MNKEQVIERAKQLSGDEDLSGMGFRKNSSGATSFRVVIDKIKQGEEDTLTSREVALLNQVITHLDNERQSEQTLSGSLNNLDNTEQSTGGESAWAPVPSEPLNSGSSGGSSSKGGGSSGNGPADYEGASFDPDKAPPVPPDKGGSRSSSSGDNSPKSILEKMLTELEKLTKNTEEQKKAVEKDTHYEQDMRKYEQYRDRTDYGINFGETIQGAIQALSPMGGSGKNLGDLTSNFGEIGQDIYSRFRQLNRPKQPRREDYTPKGNRNDSPEAEAERRTDDEDATTGDDTKSKTSRPSPKKTKSPKSKSEPLPKHDEAVNEGNYPSVPDPIKGGGGNKPPPTESIGAGAEGEALGGAELIPGIGEILLFVAALSEATKAAYVFAYAQEAEVRKLAEVGGTQASAIAVLDANRIGRQVSTAEETGQSSEKLVTALDKLEEILRPFESSLTNLANLLGAEIADGLSAMLKLLNVLVPIIDSINRLMSNQKDVKYEPMQVDKWRILEDLKKEGEKIRMPKWPSGT